MADTNITFAKIVANPNAYSWSQAYNAGKLFAVISLETTREVEEKDYLNVLGKEILDTLEQEFFTLETKDLASIKQAVTTTSEKIPNEVSCSFVIATYVLDVLYLYILGGGKVSLKRDGKLGSLLDSSDIDSKSLKDASGYLQNEDIVILQTKQFANIISIHTLSEFLDNSVPSEIAEHIAPLVHEKDEAGAASIIINYKLAQKSEDETFLEEKTEEPKTEQEESPSPFYSSSINEDSKLTNKIKPLFSEVFSVFKLRPRGELNHPRKVILTIVIVISVVFIGSIIFAVKKQGDSKNQSIFQSIYPQASKKYEEGKGLLDLNSGLAQDSFNQAKKLLEDGKNKLPQNSSEEKKLLALLTQVNQSLNQSPKPNTVNAKAVDITSSNMLYAESKNQGLYFTATTDNIYALTADSIYSLKADGAGKKTLVENDSAWTTAGGLATYFGNFYVLDKKQNQILKFVESDSTYTKSDYFSDNSSVNFSKAISMAIDSSIYVLSTNGTISKFNKGALESFTVSGLDKEFSNPTRIFTNADLSYVYVLDNGNSRIVVLEKEGKYKNQYQASIIKVAKDFDINEKNSKAYVLSGGKVYEIDLK